MAKKHVWRIKKEYFRQLETGAKKLEVRVGYGAIKRVKEGHYISFENYGDNLFMVKRITAYDSFKRMLEVEGVDKVLPGMNMATALHTLRVIYPPEREALGVYVFELRDVLCIEPAEHKILQASALLKNNENNEFADLVADSYKVTDWICIDYPLHCDHFFCKYVPGIYDGEREIFAYYVSDDIAGVIILKKDKDEKKICTLCVVEKYRKMGIATKLLEKSFGWLGTTKPLITIADYKLSQFSGVIQKYGWTENQILEKGHYNDDSREHVFNGFIS